MRHIHGALLTLSYARVSTPGIRYSCSVSKKMASRAVDRNMIKRRCREAVRRLLPPSGSFVLLCKAKAAARAATYADLQKDIEKLFQNAGIS